MKTGFEKLARAVRHVAVLPRGAAVLFGGDVRAVWLLAGLMCCSGLLPAVAVAMSRPLVDAIAGRDWAAGVWCAAVIAGALGLGELLRAVSGWVRTRVAERVQDHVMDLVHRKSVELDLSFYDSAEFFDGMHRARVEASYRPVAMIESLGSVFQNGVTLVAMLGVLVSFGWWVPAALAVSTVPALWVVLRCAVRQHEFRLRTTQDERRSWYFGWLLTARETAPEVRLFGLGDVFRERYASLRARLRRERTGLARDQAAAELCAGMIALGVSGVSLGWMLSLALGGAVTLGALAMFYQAFQQGLRLTRTLLDNVGQLYYNSLFLGNLFEFLALAPRVADGCEGARAGLVHGIRFEGVTFRYPGAERPVVCGLDLHVPAGKLVAFVGANGAGKSTFVKLLCRFYDPERGRVLIDGADVREMRLEELRSKITVLFQEPVRYNATVRENIALGGGADVERAAESAGADGIVAGLAGGYEQLLGKMFLEGAELSAGQWQRMALARAFCRDAAIVLLDEPTSAMDPWAETDWLERLRVLVEGRTAVLITHRFTTAMRADLIFVFSEGQVVEQGSHAELVALGGLYASSWRAQTEERGQAVGAGAE